MNHILTNKYSDDDIIREYSGSLFYIDEVHSIGRKDPFSGQNSEELTTVYNTLWRILHLIKRSKVMIGSATPMINNVNEIAPVLNLLLPSHDVSRGPGWVNPDSKELGQLPINIDYTQVDLKFMAPYLNGIISYVRELDTGALPVYQGEAIDFTWETKDGPIKSQSIVYVGRFMGPHQAQGYNMAKGITEEEGEENPTEVVLEGKRRAFFGLERQACLFIYPDGSVGGTFPRNSKNQSKAPHGLGKYILSPRPNEYTIPPTFRTELQLRNLPRYSSKYAEIVNIISSTPGSAFCYNEFVAGSGAIILGMCFDANGFERYNETTSIFQNISGGLRPICSAGATKGNIRLRPARRYALLTSETPDTQTVSILEAFNSYENRYGDIIKVLITSPIGRDGLNLANVQQIHLCGPS